MHRKPDRNRAAAKKTFKKLDLLPTFTAATQVDGTVLEDLQNASAETEKQAFVFTDNVYV